ncbi:dienelactone hydrolase [Aspergillus insuetus]
MTSYSPGKCCFEGMKHEGSPSGDIFKIRDIEVYVKYPENRSTESGIILLSDVFGHRFNNSQLIADQLAANGHFVVMPDLFAGDAVAIDRADTIDFTTWINGGYSDTKQSHLPPSIDPIVEACIVEMRTRYGVKKLGAVGYCFGSKYAIRFLKPGAVRVDVAYIAHPSFIDKAELEAVAGPLAISAAEKDEIFPYAKRRESEEILERLGMPYEITLYGGVEHG